MIVKNVSGAEKYFSMGKGVRGFTLASTATRVIPDSSSAWEYISQYVVDGDLAVVSGPSFLETFTPVAVPAYGFIKIDGDGTHANLATDTVTINGELITFVASGASGAEVNIGVAETNAADNLKVYINENTDTLGVTAGEIIRVGNDFWVTIYSTKNGSSGNNDTLVAAVGNDNLAVSGSGKLSGGVDSATRKVSAIQYTAAAALEDGILYIPTGLTTINLLNIMVRTDEGLIKVIDELITVSGGVVTISGQEGTTAIIEDDVIDIIAIGT